MENTDFVRTRRFSAISVMNSQEFDACDVIGDTELCTLLSAWYVAAL